MQDWDLDQTVQKLQHPYQGPEEIKTLLRRTLWHDMSAEFHAENLCHHLYGLGFVYTPEFLGFLKYWRQDEWKHYSWMAAVYGCVFKISEKWLRRTLSDEKANFLDLEGFFVDEFTILVLFAYDEILTVLSYQSDRAMYRTVDSGLITDFNKIIVDESNHFNNACDVILRRHGHRLDEVVTILTRIQNWERSKKAYGNTFLLDRRESQAFQENLIVQGCDIVRRRLLK